MWTRAALEGRPWLKHAARVAFYASYLPIALLLCGRVVFRPGWPGNHEYLAPFERVECYRRAFAAGNWLPTWSPYPFLGFGSPFPLLYHRLFNALAGCVAVAVGNSVLAVKLLIPLLLVTGGFGSYRLCRELSVSRALSWAAGILLMAAPYTFFDWLVRGAVAEFTATMIFPWWLAVLLGFARGKQRWLSLAALTVLLFHAHSVLCLFALPVAAALFVMALGTGALSLADLTRHFRRAALGLALVTIGVLPFVLAISRVLPFVNTDAFTHFTTVAKQFRPFNDYLADDKFEWGTLFFGVCPELNRYLLVTLLTLTFAAARLHRPLEQLTTRFLVGVLSACVLLQLPVSNWFYVNIPGASYLQFPWRLNSFMTPILIALCAIAGESCAVTSLRARRWSQVATFGCVLLSLRLPRQALRLDYAQFSADELRTHLAAVSDDVAGEEYLPKGVRSPIRAPPPPKKTRRALVDARWPSVVNLPSEPLVSSDCVGAWPSDFAGETLLLETNEAHECLVTIRQFKSPLLELELDNARLLPGPVGEGFRLVLLPGHARVLLRKKSVARLAAEFFSRR